mgnify:CR=1 FL=1
MNEIALMEAASSVYKRKYQCPYCNDKYDRVKLVDHIEKKHSEFIPKDFTASRIVFNIVNKKEKGKCTICGKESPWDEDKCRYDRFCSEECKKTYEQLAAERLKRVRGMTKQEMLKDPEYQNNVMLANRSISGKYKFQDGTIRTYVGSYEHKFLEFMDKFLNVKSEDLETPGPIIEYKFKGETHKWITDAYYAPYNLAFDIKDGGDNPNKREMPEYRAKQTAKEDAIRKQGKYNYIRLTDNKFEQLIELMLELKELYIENNGEYNPIIRINESTILESKKVKDLGPKVCSKCGSKNIGVFFQGEPIYKCKDCGEYLGTVPFNESTSNDIIQNAFNSVIHTIKWCRMDDSAFCSINEYSEPKIVNDNSFSVGKFVYESGIDTVVKTINDNNIFENGRYSASRNNNELIITIDKSNSIKEYCVLHDKGYFKLLDKYKDPKDCSWDEEQTYPTIDLCIKSEECYGKDMYCYIMDMDTYSIHYIGKMHISNFEDDGYSVDWLEITDDYPFPRDDINEACKNTEEARKFVADVRKIAKKYDANFFIVTDGASGYNNGPNSNPAVKNARDQQIEWEKKNGFDPDEDWSKSIKESVNINSTQNFNPKLRKDERNIKESLEVKLTTSPFEKEMVLYHGSPVQDKLSIINPNSYNAGTRLSKPRMSSFWTRKFEYAKLFGLFRVICSELKYKCFFAGDAYHIYVRPSDYNDILRDIKSKHIWIYKKTLDKKYITGSNTYYIDEFTIDVPVKPDESIKIEYNDFIDLLKDTLIMLPDDSKETRKRISDRELKVLAKAKLPKDIINMLIYYNADDVLDKVKDYKSLKEFSIITPSSDKPSQEGFIGHGSWNAIKKVDGEPYRERVEVIIFNKELDKVLIGTRKSDGSVKLPGGGTDKNSSLESQAAKECQEEVKVNIDNLKYIGSYSMSNEQAGYNDGVYKGQYTYLYLATYDSDYTGYIRPEDLDSLYDTAKWMNIYDAKELLKKRSVDLYNLFNYNYKLYINDLSYLKL